ncbi:trans-aconitate 2-methyltransferase [Flexivirga endophytica]|uniref:Trans-aconitate 2-methyltransferase n=1 Tax=Flexivirga endophytica TaxID=1849103 RepID=A0A916X1U3_9MICO|nr:methyltransferase domain-containing protein [Flexivirga endophytica]GGB47981.1 trans-aconitate 2-methyltransferase [Flexivirga endophytica]GHB60922.1 trans-aconitate 2-methyltransferase [Flexivirga endophytica]
MATWDPQQYERFSDLRNRPFGDLIARVGAVAPERVVDLGCGNGPLTLSLADRWPRAQITGVDSSDSMLERAAALDVEHRVHWELADVNGWEPDSEPEVLVTNATLQWVPGHLTLIDRWLSRLPDGGWFAMQVPGNFDAPSHRIIREVARAHDRAADRAGVPAKYRSEERAENFVGWLEGALRDAPVESPERYAEALAAHCGHVDVWETTYLQVLDPQGAQRSPVLEWVKGTALRPLLDVLDDSERAALLEELVTRFDVAYPRAPYGTPMPFRRIFAVGRKGASV